MLAQQRPSAAMSTTSFFSQITSFFGGSSSQASMPSSRKSAFGNGLPSSSQRGPPKPLDPNAWSLPYNSYNDAASPATTNGFHSPNVGHYPPLPSAGRPTSPYAHDAPSGVFSTSSVAEFANMYPSASTSTLVAPNNSRSRVQPLSSSARSATGVMIPSTAYPPLRHTWNRILKWCDSNYEEVGDTLNWPCTEEALDELEMAIGFTLPSAVRESFLCYDGQELESNQSCQDGLFFGLALLSVDQVAQEWKFWRAVDEDPETGVNPQVKALMSSCPHKWIRQEYSCRGWIPLITDRAGNYIGVDLAPHPAGGGAPGQVILFGRDFDTKVVVWRGEGEGGWGRFLQSFAEELENGEIWALEEPSSASDDEEDAIGYESYFSGGGAGASKGGGDRAGESNAAFRLRGEYKGWPVLEAWADRSVRYWESVGLAPGKPLQTSQPTAEDVTPSLRTVDEHREPYDTENSSTRSRRGSSVMHGENGDGADASHPLADVDVSGVGDASSTQVFRSSQPPSASEASGAATTTTNSVTPTNSNRRIGDMLSPPLLETKSLRKQKQREEGWGSPNLYQQPARRPVRPPPAPAQSLDLPTIEDVKAIQAAVLADDGRSHSIQFNTADNQPSLSSLSSLGYHDFAAKTSSAPKIDSMELENRTSTEVILPPLYTGHIVGVRGRARGLGNESNVEDANSTFSSDIDDPLRTNTAATRTASSSSSPRDQVASFGGVKNYSTHTPETQKAFNMTISDNHPSLIDANSVPNSPVTNSYASTNTASESTQSVTPKLALA